MARRAERLILWLARLRACMVAAGQLKTYKVEQIWRKLRLIREREILLASADQWGGKPQGIIQNKKRKHHIRLHHRRPLPRGISSPRETAFPGISQRIPSIHHRDGGPYHRASSINQISYLGSGVSSKKIVAAIGPSGAAADKPFPKPLGG